MMDADGRFGRKGPSKNSVPSSAFGRISVSEMRVCFLSRRRLQSARRFRFRLPRSEFRVPHLNVLV